MLWAISGIFAMIGLKSLAKNHVGKLVTYVVGNLLFGVTALCWGAYELLQKVLVDFKVEGPFKVGFPSFRGILKYIQIISQPGRFTPDSDKSIFYFFLTSIFYDSKL